MHNVITLPAVDDDWLKGARRFAVDVVGGDHIATGELLSHTFLGDQTGQLIGLRWNDGQLDAGSTILDTIIAAAPSGRELHAVCQVGTHQFIADRRALFESRGFCLWQEKEGFWYADEGQPLPEPEHVTVRTVGEIGRDAYAEIVAACAPGTLDRVDTDAVATMGAHAWAADFITEYLRDHEQDIWYALDDLDGAPIGFVAVGEMPHARDDEKNTGTILHIGVVTARRGRGYVDQLMRLVNLATRARGWVGVISDTDVLNVPMQAALERHGHHAAARPFHTWYYRRTC